MSTTTYDNMPLYLLVTQALQYVREAEELLQVAAEAGKELEVPSASADVSGSLDHLYRVDETLRELLGDLG